MIIKHCLICQTPIKVSPSQIFTKKTCSKICDNKWRKESGRYSGKNNPAHKGGVATYTNGQGMTYRYIIGKGKKIPEHRFVMEQYLARSLNLGEEVHHINGDTLDNRPENLYVIDKKNHSRIHRQLFMKVQKLEQQNRRLKAKIISLSSEPLL